MSGFARIGSYSSERLALAYFAREANRAGLLDAANIVKEATEKNKNPVQPNVAHILLHIAPK